MSTHSPRYGEVWLADLDPIVGHEQAGRRPVIVISHDKVNSGASGLVIAIPLTTTNRKHTWHIRIDPPEGGLKYTSFALSDHVRAISKERLLGGSAFGEVSPGTLDHIRTILHFLLG